MSLKHAILAMLDIDPGSGYDLTKRFDQSVGFFWPSSFQQVYRDLNAMEEQGLVSAQAIAQEGKPDKKHYEITDAGIAELQRWLGQPAKAMKIKDTFLIKLFGGRRASSEELLDDLRRQRQLHQSNLDRYSELAQSLDELDPLQAKKYLLPYQTLDLGIRFEQTWLSWCDDLEAKWDELAEALGD